MSNRNSVESVMRSFQYVQEVGLSIKDANYEMDKADLKYLLANLTSAIATSKMELTLLQAECEVRNAELIRMHEVLLYKGNLRRRGDGYYKTLNGQPYGQPYCSHCWESDFKMLHLHNRILSKDVRVCPSCKNEFQAIRTPFLESRGATV